METKFDAIIIGAGVIGSAIGFELSKKGYKTSVSYTHLRAHET